MSSKTAGCDNIHRPIDLETNRLSMTEMALDQAPFRSFEKKGSRSRRPYFPTEHFYDETTNFIQQEPSNSSDVDSQILDKFPSPVIQLGHGIWLKLGTIIPQKHNAVVFHSFRPEIS